MARLRDNKMVSLKEHYNKVKVKEGNYLPLSSAPYQFSVTFAHTFLCRYQYDIYHQVNIVTLKPLSYNIMICRPGSKSAHSWPTLVSRRRL